MFGLIIKKLNGEFWNAKKVRTNLVPAKFLTFPKRVSLVLEKLKIKKKFLRETKQPEYFAAKI